MTINELLWAVPILVLSLGLWRPRVGLCALVASLPLFGTPPAGPYLAQLNFVGLAAVIIGLRVPGSHNEATPLDRALPWAVGGWVATSLASLPPLAYLPPSWRPLQLIATIQSLPDAHTRGLIYSWSLTQQLLLGVTLFWAVRRVYRGHSVAPMARALAIGLSYLLLLGLAEHLGLIDLSAFRPIGNPLYENRLHSLFFHSGWLAQYLVVATPFALAGLLSGGRLARLAASGLLLATLVTLLFTHQRGSWLVAVSQVLLTLVLTGGRVLRQRRLQIALVAITASVIAIVLLIGVLQPASVEPLTDRLRTTVADLSGREQVWKNTLDLSAERQFRAYGLGSFGPVYEHRFPCQRLFCWSTSHNLYIQTLFERGLLGLAALLLLVATVGLTVRDSLSSRTEEQHRLSIGLAVSLGGALIYGCVQNVIYIQSIEWLLFILLACVAVSSPPRPRRVLVRCAQALIGLALLAVPFRLWILEPTPGAGNRTHGFHMPELKHDGSVVRWTTEQATERVPWTGEELLVELYDGTPWRPQSPLVVVLRVDGEELWRGPVGADWKTARLPVGPPSRDSLLLEIFPSRTFRPFSEVRRQPDYPPSRDIRQLGVVVRGIWWESSEPESSPP